jgi:uncharacterized NAD(P)/FAD-binding protein YdhS
MHVGQSIALIGGGPTAVCCFVSIVRALGPRPSCRRIQIFEPNTLGGGRAFTEGSRILIANTSVGVSSAIQGRPDDLLQWLVAHPEVVRRWGCDPAQVDARSFLPRALIGEYLADLFDTYRDQARRLGVDVVITRAHIAGLSPIGDRCLLRARGGKAYLADRVVLCTGTRPKIAFAALRHHGAYHVSPYPADTLMAAVRPLEDVIVLGSKLSAIDASLLMEPRIEQGRITMISPSGTLPSVRTEILEYAPRFFKAANVLGHCGRNGGRVTFEVVDRFIRMELEHERQVRKLDGAEIPFASAQSPREQLRQDLDASRSQRNFWQYPIASFINQINELWSYMDAAARDSFVRAYGDFMSRYVSAIPEQNASKLMALFNAGVLRVARGEVRLTYDDHGGKFIARGGGIDGVFDRVVDATGFEPSPNAARILSEVLGQGRPLEGAIDARRLKLTTEQAKDIDVFVAGPALAGSLPITNYLNASARQAHVIGQQIVA